MRPFRSLFRDLAERETRVAQILDPPPAGAANRLPADEYAFEEWYCVDPACDCRRVLFFVGARYADAQLATISHSFDPPGKRSYVREQTFLDPLLPQSDLAPSLLKLCNDLLLTDPAYCRRLERHYRMVKDAIADPDHPGQRVLGSSSTEQESKQPKASRLQDFLPPKRRGKRKWK